MATQLISDTFLIDFTDLGKMVLSVSCARVQEPLDWIGDRHGDLKHIWH